jgi:hypothetical protein
VSYTPGIELVLEAYTDYPYNVTLVCRPNLHT